jgi:hypothetical protein
MQVPVASKRKHCNLLFDVTKVDASHLCTVPDYKVAATDPIGSCYHMLLDVEIQRINPRPIVRTMYCK